MTTSIRWKLVAWTGIPIAIVFATGAALSYRKLSTLAHEQVRESLQERVRQHAHRFNSDLVTPAQVARSTAEFLEIEPGLSSAQIERLVQRNVALDPRVYGSAIAFAPHAFSPDVELYSPYAHRTADGIDLMDIAREAYDYRTWEWYSIPSTYDTAIWTEPYFDEGAGGVLMTTYSAPFHRSGVVAGIATVDVKLEDLQEWGHGEGLEDTTFLIVSRNGTILSHPDPSLITKAKLLDLPSIRDRPEMRAYADRLLRQGNEETIDGFIEGRKSVVVHALIPATGWHLIVAMPEDRVMAPVWAQLRSYVAGRSLVLLLALVILLIVSWQVTRPILRLAQEFERVGGGDLTVTTGHWPNDEIGVLARTFDDTVVRLQQHVAALTAETARREAVETDLRIARNIQSSLIPRTFPPYPDRPEFELHATLEPARHVAGDFYDFFFVEGDRLVVVVADVSGKGVPAALFMAVARTLLRTIVGSGIGPAEALTRINSTLAQDNDNGYFVTMSLAYYDVATGRVAHANAGHPPPLLVTGPGAVRDFGKATGPVLGVVEGMQYGELEDVIGPGESLVFATDGATEARAPDREFFGDERFEQLVGTLYGVDARTACEAIRTRLAEFQAGNPADDLTLLVLRRAPA